MRAFDNPQAHVIINRHLRNGERERSMNLWVRRTLVLLIALDMFALQSRLFPFKRRSRQGGLCDTYFTLDMAHIGITGNRTDLAKTRRRGAGFS